MTDITMVYTVTNDTIAKWTYVISKFEAIKCHHSGSQTNRETIIHQFTCPRRHTIYFDGRQHKHSTNPKKTEELISKANST
jgi:hypothetical protein